MGDEKTMEKNKKVLYIVAAIVLVLAGVITYRIYHNISANKERALRMGQGKVLAVETAAVGRRDISPLLNFSAGLEPLWNADISAKLDGRIDRLNVEEGDRVSAGTVLAVLDTNELEAQVSQAQGNLYSAQANLEQAESDLRRTAALAKQGAISEQALDTARIKRDMAVGQVNSVQGNVAALASRLGYAEVIAPRDGIVVKRFLQSGYYAKAGTAMITLADVTTLLAKATVGEAQIGQLQVGAEVKVLVNAYPGKEFSGRITRISPMASLPARTFTAEISIPNSEGLLKPGMFANTFVRGAFHKNALVVPESALVMREDQKTVFVVLPDNTVQQRVLTLGYVGDGWAEVLDGLQEGDQIVVSGQNKLSDGVRVSAGSKEGDSK